MPNTYLFGSLLRCHVLMRPVLITRFKLKSSLRTLHMSFLFCFSVLMLCYIYFVVVQLLNCVQLFAAPWTVVHQASLSMGLPRQEHWSGLPFPSPGDLPNPGIKRTSLAWQADPLPLSHLGSVFYIHVTVKIRVYICIYMYMYR